MEVLNEQPDLTDGKEEKVADGSIVFENVSFVIPSPAEEKRTGKYQSDHHSGETIGIIGGTGSAKSTLVQLIPRLYDTTSGRVLVGGKDVKDYTIRALRDAVSMVLQKNVLFSGSIRDNLRWGDENATDERFKPLADPHKRTDLSKASPTAMTPIWARAASMFPAVRNNDSALHGLC